MKLTPEFKERILKAAKDGPISEKMLRDVFPEAFCDVVIDGIPHVRIRIGQKFKRGNGVFFDNTCMFCQVGDNLFTLIHLNSGNRWTGREPFKFSFEEPQRGPFTLLVLVPVLSEIWGRGLGYKDWQVVDEKQE